jgi:hypothetical protein
LIEVLELELTFWVHYHLLFLLIEKLPNLGNRF